jgi:general secretion pathway protein D
LGFLFSTRAHTKDKTNLYIFLTPRVIQSPEEATKVADTKRNQIDELREEQIKLYRGGRETTGGDAQIEPAIESLQYRETEEPDSGIETAPDQSDTVDPRSPSPDQSNAATLNDGDQSPAAKTAKQPPEPPGTPMKEKRAPTVGMSAYTPASSSAAASEDNGTDDAGKHRKDTDAEPTNEQTPLEPAAQPSGTPHGYTLQVAAVKNTRQADEILVQLTGLGYAAYTVQNKIGDDVWYRLRVGFFERREDASKLMARLRSAQFNPILIKF